MLIPAESLLKRPVMSLQTGSELARTKSAIIDPRNLTIVAYELEGTLLGEATYLLISDVREISQIGFIVDSADEFVVSDDVIKLKEIINFGFIIEGIAVVDERNRKLGKVDGYIIEAGSFVVQQIRVKRPLLRSLNDTELLINRTQIVNVSNDKITVKNTEVPPEAIHKTTTRSYANPFRGTTPQPEAINTEEH